MNVLFEFMRNFYAPYRAGVIFSLRGVTHKNVKINTLQFFLSLPQYSHNRISQTRLPEVESNVRRK